MLQCITHDNVLSMEPDIQNNLQSIMEENTADILNMYPENSVRHIFWEQQLDALQMKDKHQLHWHSAIIKWCLHLKFKSSGAYHGLRSNGVLTLPSERTLRDHTHWVKCGIGFRADVNEQLMRETNTQEEDKYAVLVFDEVKIREDLVFNKHSCELIGFTGLGDIFTDF